MYTYRVGTGWSHLLRVVGALVVIAGLSGLAVYSVGDVMMWIITAVGVVLVAGAKLFYLDVRVEAADASKRAVTPQRALADEQRERLQALAARARLRVGDGTRRAAGFGLVVGAGLLAGLLARAVVAPFPPIIAVPAFVLGLAVAYAASTWLRLRRAAIAPGLYCDGEHLIYATVDEVLLRRLGGGALITLATAHRDDGSTAVSLALRDNTIETVVLRDTRAADELVVLLRVGADGDDGAPGSADEPLEGPPAPGHIYRALDEPADAREQRIVESLERGARGASAQRVRARRKRAVVASGVALASALALLTICTVVEQRHFLAHCVVKPEVTYSYPPACHRYFERFSVRILAGSARDRIAAIHRARFEAARDTPAALRTLIKIDPHNIAGLDEERADALGKLLKIGGARRLRELYGLAQKRLGSTRCRGVPQKVARALHDKLALARAGSKPELPVVVHAFTEGTEREVKLGALVVGANVRVAPPAKVFDTPKNARRARAIAAGVGHALARLLGNGTLQTPARWRVDSSALHAVVIYKVTPDAGRLFRQKGTFAYGAKQVYVGLRFAWSFELYHRGQRVFRFERVVEPPPSLTVTTYSYGSMLARMFGASASSIYERMAQIAIVRFIEQLGAALGHC
ncbi:MAG: hypothetical protein KC503_38670 [Myxococcales bacterium]|nr:hypothetical protein [Myxococcales bacterium]